jgi:hypothetical protein
VRNFVPGVPEGLSVVIAHRKRGVRGEETKESLMGIPICAEPKTRRDDVLACSFVI